MHYMLVCFQCAVSFDQVDHKPQGHDVATTELQVTVVVPWALGGSCMLRYR